MDFFYASLNQIANGQMLEKANLLLLTKEVTDKDQSLKHSPSCDRFGKTEKISGEQIWKNLGYFGDEKANFNIEKKNFPENALFYVNQGLLLRALRSTFARL